jgi:hypothetical protein
MSITEADRKYLKNKNKGGKNNAKGNRYENYYAVFQIALLLNSYHKKLDDVYLTTQLSNAYVDDLLIDVVNSSRTYHQIKDVKNLSWNKGKLKFDFKRQKETCLDNKEVFSLKLVHSNQTIHQELVEIPKEFSDSAQVEFFPAYNELGLLYWHYSPFKDAIAEIVADGSDNDDVLYGVAGSILGAWESVNTENPISLKQIKENINKINPYDALKTYPTIELPDSCKKILDDIGVTFYSKGKILHWKYGNLEGKIEWSEEIEQNLLNNVPTKIEELISILS